MNYELAICFLFILLFIIYFYIRKQPIIEGAGKFDPFKKINDFVKKIPKEIKKIPTEIKKIPKEIKKIPKEIEKIPKEIEKGTTKIIKDAEKKTKAEFNKAKEATTKVVKDAEKVTKDGIKATTKVVKDAEKAAKKGITIIETELKKVKDSILGPIMKFAKQMMDFFKNLGRLFVDWANFINGNILCAIKNVSNPVCLLLNVIRLIGFMLYGFVWIIIVIFAGQSMADSFECIITRITDFLWKFRPKILATCGKGCSAEIPLWAGKKMRSPADKAKSKCNAKSKSKIKIEEESLTSVRTFYWVVLIFFVSYKLGLPSVVQKWFTPPSNVVLNEINPSSNKALNEINPPSNMAFNETNNQIPKPIADK